MSRATNAGRLASKQVVILEDPDQGREHGSVRRSTREVRVPAHLLRSLRTVIPGCAAALLLVSVAACEDAAPEQTIVADSAGIRVVTNAAAMIDSQAALPVTAVFTWRLRPTLKRYSW